jgi:hypothetical protein
VGLSHDSLRGPSVTITIAGSVSTVVVTRPCWPDKHLRPEDSMEETPPKMPAGSNELKLLGGKEGTGGADSTVKTLRIVG